MRTFVIGAFLALLAPVTQAAAGQYVPGRELSLAFHEDGTVDLLARNVTTREILAEWARQCQCHVVNAEQLTGGAMMQPVQFARAQQADVLQSLLRSAAGYVLTRQRAGAPGVSQYETIYILATSHPVTGAYVPPPAPPPMGIPTPGNPDDELAPVTPAASPQAPAPQAPADSSNPFGSRSTSPFVTISPVTSSPNLPGAPVTAPQAPDVPPAGQIPPAPPPPRPGTVVPIVPVQ